MPTPLALIWDLIAKDSASPAFLRVAGAADKAATSTGRAAAKIEGSAARITKVGAKMTKGITLPLIGIGVVAADQAAKFQKSMTLIQTAGGESAAKTAVISAGIKKLAVDTGTSLGALSDGIYTIAKAGAQKWSAAGQLEVLRAAAQGAKAENVDLGVATDALSTIMFDYGAKTSQAVKYEDLLVRGSGLAKTSMQQYAGSLSNVVPIAAATGLSFEEVGGAIATMTQHGVSAQQATENLRNLITNLAGQNNVASGAMQQLGINTVDLAKNLGTRGLSGTLAIVDKALKDHTKNGVIVTDVHKAAALATKSLNTEMGTFTGKLLDQSRGLLNGQTGITTYTKFAKSLGGTAGASALQFLALYKSSQGFSDQLKSGKGTITTTVGALNKMLGGITGTSVALQIGGKYAQQNADNVKAMGKAFITAGSDVLGWNKTQDTLAVKMDKAKASLQVMAVEIGSALIPAFSKIVDKIAGVVHSFDGLDASQKKIIGFGLLAVAALGPVLALGGRIALLGSGISRAAVGIGNALANIGSNTTGMSTKATTAIKGLTSAMSGAAIGFAVGQLTKNSSDSVKAIGALGAAAAGATIGFGMGGPLGAAIGGVAGGLAGLVTSFGGVGHAATKASREAAAALAMQTDAANNLLDALKQVNGAYNEQTRTAVVNQLQKSGALRDAATVGVNPKRLVSAAMGNAADLNQVQTQILQSPAMEDIQKKIDAGKKLTDAEKELDDAGTRLLKVLDNTTLGSGKAEKAFELYQQALGKTTVPTNLLAGGVKNLGKELNGTGTSLDHVTAYGIRNNAVILDNVTAANAAVVAGLKHHRTVAQVATAYETQISALRQNLTQMGFNGAAIDDIVTKYGSIPSSVVTELLKRGVLPADIQAIVNKYHLIPGSKTTYVNAVDAASATIGRIRAELSNLNGSTANVYIATSSALPGGGHTTKKFSASGGFISGPGSGTSDSIPAMLSNGEYVINAAQTRKHRALLASINAGRQGFATGGHVAKKATDIVVGGLHYASANAASNAITRALQALGVALPKFITALGKTVDQIKNAETALIKDARASGASKSTLNGITKDFAKINKLAAQRDAINAKLGTRSKADAQTAFEKLDAVVTAFKDEISTVAQAITSGFNILTAGQNTTGTPSPAYQQALDRHNAGRQLPGDAAILGAGDGTDGGGTSVTDILGNLAQQIAAAKKFRTELAQLKKEGLSDALYKQLAEAGVSGAGDTVDALATQATAGQIKKLTGDYKTLQDIAGGTGKDVATETMGKQLKAAQDTVAALQAQTKTLGAKIDHIGASVAAALNTTAGKAALAGRTAPAGRTK